MRGSVPQMLIEPAKSTTTKIIIRTANLQPNCVGRTSVTAFPYTHTDVGANNGQTAETLIRRIPTAKIDLFRAEWRLLR